MHVRHVCGQPKLETFGLYMGGPSLPAIEVRHRQYVIGRPILQEVIWTLAHHSLPLAGAHDSELLGVPLNTLAELR